MQIRTLERQLGVQLLRRSPRGSTLTEAGTEMLPHLRALLRAEEAAKQHASALIGNRGGKVRVAGVNSAVVGLLPDAIRETTEKHPELDVEVAELTSAEVREGVYDGTFEIGLPADTIQHLERLGIVDRPGIASEILTEGPLMLVARHDHQILKAPIIDRALVAQEPIVTLRPGYSLREFTLEYLAGCSPRIVSEVLNHDTVRRLVAVGLGVTIMPQMTFEVVSDFTGELAARSLADSHVRACLSLLHPGNDAPPTTRALTSAIRKAARRRFVPKRHPTDIKAITSDC